MNRSLTAGILGAAVVLGSAVLLAAPRGTPAEARAMLEKAVNHYTSAGRKQALADFTAGKRPFRDRDLYVICITSARKFAANGGFPKVVGRSADSIRDSNGRQLGKLLWNASSKAKQGSVQYGIINPITKQVEMKTTFYRRVADDLLCGVGAYSAP